MVAMAPVGFAQYYSLTAYGGYDLYTVQGYHPAAYPYGWPNGHYGNVYDYDRQYDHSYDWYNPQRNSQWYYWYNNQYGSWKDAYYKDHGYDNPYKDKKWHGSYDYADRCGHRYDYGRWNVECYD